MDVKQKQLATYEQEVVLRNLAHAAARPNVKFLEVGSWCGDSSVLLAQVAREYGGQLFCVDWWKGNPQTELAAIAAREDIFSVFWARIRREGLEDVVVPLRGSSEVVAQVLKPQSFHLVFLDADHRHQAITRDIRDYAPLVSGDGGILCGHDCEGRIADYDPAFLEEGKAVDYHETVHCGVVLAVGTAFVDYSVNHSIWSVRAAGASSAWEPTNLTFPGIPDRRQAPPPRLGVTNSRGLVRYGKHIYVIPHGWDDFDVTDDAQRNSADIISVTSLREAEEVVWDGPILPPVLVEEGYLGFNIVSYNGLYYSLAHDLGALDLTRLPDEERDSLKRQWRLLIADSHQGARQQAVRAHLQAEQ